MGYPGEPRSRLLLDEAGVCGGEEHGGAEAVRGAGFSNIAQGRVASGVALDVVNGFEIVDIDQGDGQPVPVALNMLQFALELDLDAAAVERSGEGVLERLVAAARDEFAA